MRHFALSRLYLHCREKASVTDNCLEDPSPAPAAVVVPRLKNWVGWLCFKWDFRLVVLPLFVATVFKQSRHTGSFTLIVSPLSFGLKPKCSHSRTFVPKQLPELKIAALKPSPFFLTGCSCPETLYNAVGSRLLFTCRCPLCVRVCGGDAA